MIALDTNVLARLGMVADDRRQSEAAATLIDSGGAFFVPLTVTLELEWILRGVYCIDRRKISVGLHGLIAVRNLHFEQEAAVLAALQLYDEGFDFSDALHHASSAGCASFATFDDSFFKRAAARGLVPSVELS